MKGGMSYKLFIGILLVIIIGGLAFFGIKALIAKFLTP